MNAIVRMVVDGKIHEIDQQIEAVMAAVTSGEPRSKLIVDLQELRNTIQRIKAELVK